MSVDDVSRWTLSGEWAPLEYQKSVEIRGRDVDNSLHDVYLSEALDFALENTGPSAPTARVSAPNSTLGNNATFPALSCSWPWGLSAASQAAAPLLRQHHHRGRQTQGVSPTGCPNALACSCRGLRACSAQACAATLARMGASDGSPGNPSQTTRRRGTPACPERHWGPRAPPRSAARSQAWPPAVGSDDRTLRATPRRYEAQHDSPARTARRFIPP